MRGTISLCMIVKDEEQVLERCLQSIHAHVDEIIIIDTGSTDRTKEIGFQYTNHIFDAEWTQDFSAARNLSLQHATGNWILVLDADEYVTDESINNLLNQLEGIDTSSPAAVSGSILNYTGESNAASGTYTTSATRIFTNHHGLYYQGAIHEQLTSPDKPIRYYKTDYQIYHSGYTEDIRTSKSKSERNLAILTALSPDRQNEPYYQFKIGSEFYMLQQYGSALPRFESAVMQATRDEPWYHNCMVQFITSLVVERQYEKAWRWSMHSLGQKPNHADYLCLTAIILSSCGMYYRSEKLYRLCLNLKSEKIGDMTWLVHSHYASRIPLQNLLDISRKQLNTTNSLDLLIQLLSIDPMNFPLLRQLIAILQQYMSGEESIQALCSIYSMQDPGHLFILYRAAAQAGYPALAELFYSMCLEQHIPLKAEDHLQYAILLNNESLYRQLSQSAESLDDSNDSRLLARIADRLWNGSGSLWNAEDDETLSLLIRCFHFQLFDWFDEIIPQCAPATIQQFADYLFQMHYVSVAYEYYVLLLEQNQLHLNGYKNLVHIYLFNELSDDAASLAEQALTKYNDVELAGLYFDTFAQDQVVHEPLISGYIPLFHSFNKDRSLYESLIVAMHDCQK